MHTICGVPRYCATLVPLSQFPHSRSKRRQLNLTIISGRLNANMKLDRSILLNDRNNIELQKYAAKLQSIPMNGKLAIVLNS